MKVNELRIGNIYHGDVMTEENPQVITGGDIVELETDPLDDYYKPIPLTEEWLLKFGFEKAAEFYTKSMVNAPDIIISYVNSINGYQKGYVLCDPDGCEISYHGMRHVHQLQNLYFALTGEELTIKQ
jgi:hypothetical protein